MRTVTAYPMARRVCELVDGYGPVWWFYPGELEYDELWEWYS